VIGDVKTAQPPTDDSRSINPCTPSTNYADKSNLAAPLQALQHNQSESVVNIPADIRQEQDGDGISAAGRRSRRLPLRYVNSRSILSSILIVE
jgi:hypothetical protein